MHGRTFLLTITLSVAGLAYTAPAGAAEAVRTYTDTELVAGRSADGAALTTVIDTLRDTRGRALSRKTSTHANPSLRAYEDLPFACAHEGYRSGFSQHEKEEVFKDGKNDKVQVLFFPYSVDGARTDTRTGQVHKQWLICGTGGADSDNGSRTMIARLGITYQSEDVTYKTGHIWQEGKTPGSFTVNLGFQVSRDPVAVKGGITQTPTDSLRGSFNTPFESESRRYIRNGSNGWWESHCSPDCASTGGSPNFHGSVAEALYEFPQSKPVSIDDFRLASFHRHFCSNVITGCG